MMRCMIAALLLMFLSVAEATPNQVGHARMGVDRIELDDQIRFELDSNDLTRTSTTILRDVAQLLRAHPEIVRIEIHGHTDSQGTEAYNLELSQRRADEVARFLVESGVSAHRVTARGYGEARPLVGGQSEWSHRKNRRVEFIVVRR